MFGRTRPAVGLAWNPGSQQLFAEALHRIFAEYSFMFAEQKNEVGTMNFRAP